LLCIRGTDPRYPDFMGYLAMATYDHFGILSQAVPSVDKPPTYPYRCIQLQRKFYQFAYVDHQEPFPKGTHRVSMVVRKHRAEVGCSRMSPDAGTGGREQVPWMLFCSATPSGLISRNQCT
jgi:hypothetical protein